jgi:hypothetical protein
VPPRPQPVPQPTPVVVPTLSCGQVLVVERDGKITLVGFVGSDDDLVRVRAAAPEAEVQVAVRPWPQCEAIETLDRPLARAASDRPTVHIRKPSDDKLAAGEELVFEVETPAYQSYIHAAYIQADGSVLNLVQPGVGSLQSYPPHSKLTLGNEPGSSRRFRVSAPFGREMLIVLAGRSPIFQDSRPRQETEREFLTALRAALVAKIDPNAPDRDVGAGFDTVVTVQGPAP